MNTGSNDLLVGLSVLFGVLVIGVGIVVFVYRDKWRDIKAMMTLLAFLAIMPMGAMMVQQRTNWFTQADTEVKIVGVDVQKVSDKVVVYLTMSESSIAYMNYLPEGSTKKIVVIPVGKVEKRVGQSFEFSPGKTGGIATFMVNGREVLFEGRETIIPGL